MGNSKTHDIYYDCKFRRRIAPYGYNHKYVVIKMVKYNKIPVKVFLFIMYMYVTIPINIDEHIS